jgi:chromosome partitioning protein
MRTFAVINQKGGTGKTTTAINLSAALGELKKKVLLIDMDPQASATLWLGKDANQKGLLDVFTDEQELADLIIENTSPGVDFIPSSSWLIGLEKALAGDIGVESIFREALEGLPKKWDYIMIDCPPSLGLISISALVSVKEVIVPVEAHVMALTGLGQLMKTIERVKQRLNPELIVSAVLPCRVRSQTRLAKEVIETLKKHFGGQLLNTVIRENIKLAEAPSFEQPITQYDSHSNGAKDYRAAAKEIIKQKGHK